MSTPEIEALARELVARIYESGVIKPNAKAGSWLVAKITAALAAAEMRGREQALKEACALCQDATEQHQEAADRAIDSGGGIAVANLALAQALGTLEMRDAISALRKEP